MYPMCVYPHSYVERVASVIHADKLLVHDTQDYHPIELSSLDSGTQLAGYGNLLGTHEL